MSSRKAQQQIDPIHREQALALLPSFRNEMRIIRTHQVEIQELTI